MHERPSLYARWKSSGADPITAKDSYFKEFNVDVEALADRQVRFTITTSDPDRERDVVDAQGIEIENFLRNPVVLFGHDYKSLPVGRCIQIERQPNKIVATTEFATADLNPMAEQVYRMIKAGFLKACSIGFRPLEWNYNEDRRGVDFVKSELLEYSIVPVPANAMALIAASKAGIDVGVIKSWATRALQACEAQELVERAAATPAEPTRWNKSLSKSFDVSAQEFPPRSAEQALVAKYCGCAVKGLHSRETRVPAMRMGTFLSALQDILKDATIDDQRNIDGSGEEAAPLFEQIQLNSRMVGEFLVDGTRFMQWGGAKIALRSSPRWYGIEMRLYASRDQRNVAEAFFGAVNERAKSLSFLKGEAFALSGEFLARGEESYEDLFLDEKNGQAIKRLATLIAEHGAQMENRGALLVGPPGTGKTLSGRILMNKAPATFIWISSRDFHYGGSFGTMAEAFEVARENAPTILFIEDVDNWLTPTTVDLLKTEMDGISQSRGVMTILTTNYPELLPKALIDRPGRFHDVLRFDLPNEAARTQMLARWLPELTDAEAVADVVRELGGFSGAHVREFARFAGIIREQDGLDIAEAARAALAKLQEQRDLITSVQTSGSRYRAPSVVLEKRADYCRNKDISPAGDSFADPEVYAAPGDAAGADAGEEAAELVAYQTLAHLLGQATASVSAAQTIAAALIASETGAGGDTAADEAAEEAVESAQLASLRTICGQACLALQSAVALALSLDAGDAKAARLAVTKAGRVLSRSNEAKLRMAVGALETAAEQIKTVLKTVEEDARADDEAGDEPVLSLAADVVVREPGDDAVLMLAADAISQTTGDEVALELAADDDGDDDVIEIVPDVLAAAMRDALASMAATIQQETQSAIRALRGQVD